MQREYGLNLMDVLPSLSWRRLNVLVRGLSSNSATVVAFRARWYTPSGKPREQVNELRTPKQSEAAFAAIFGARPRPVRVN